MYERMIILKNLFLSSAIVALLLAGCRDSSENREDESSLENEETTEEVESAEIEDENTEEDEVDDETSDSLVGAITDTDPIPIEDYDKGKWAYADVSHLERKITNEVFKEGNNIYIGTDSESMMSLTTEYDT